jgi:hypothetical protein
MGMDKFCSNQIFSQFGSNSLIKQILQASEKESNATDREEELFSVYKLLLEMNLQTKMMNQA